MSQLKYISLHIKPLCDEIIKNPSVEVINKLSEELEKIEDSYLQQFRDFILLPLIAQIEDYSVAVNKNEMKTHLINCITTLLSKTKLEKVVQFKTILIVLLKQIYDVASGCVIANLSEEFKLSLIECVSVASNNIMTNVLDEFYMEENSKFIAQIAHVCVQLIQNENYRKLRMASINCLLSIFQLNSTSDGDDIVMRAKISHIVFIILPKIFTTLLHVTQEDDVRGVSLKVLALKSIRLVLTLIFEDYNKLDDRELELDDFKKVVNAFSANEIKSRSDEDILGISMSSLKDPTQRLQQLSSIKKSDEWFLAASRKLGTCLDLFIKIRRHSNRDIRLELAQMNCDLIVKCSRNMMPCVPHYIETIITLCDDQDKDVRSICTKTLYILFYKKHYVNIFKETQNLFKFHLIKLPRIICREDDQEILSGITTLHSYIKILNPAKLKTILNDNDILTKLMKILIQIVEVDLTGNQIMLEEYSLRNSNEIVHFDELNLPWKQFKYLKSNDAITKVQDTCKLLGRGDSSQLIFTHLFDLLEQSREESSEILILLNFCVTSDCDHLILENILDEYLKDYHWELTIQNNIDLSLQCETNNGGNVYLRESRTEGLYEGETRIKYSDLKSSGNHSYDDDNLITIYESKLHILHTCLVTENTGNLSGLLKVNFHNYLFKTFHKFLEKAGSTNYMIHQSGMYALNKIRLVYAVPRISDMIFKTTDYLIYHLKILFRKNEYNNVGLDILCVVLKYGSSLLLPYLQIIVNDVLSQNLNARNDVTSYLKLLEMCVYALRKWKNEKNMEKDSSGETIALNDETVRESAPDTFLCKENKVNQESNLKLWLSILESNKIVPNPSVADCEDEPDSNEKEEMEEEPSIETKLPNDVELTLLILKTCVKFVSAKNKTDKLIVLRAINQGVELLKEHENHLFPFIHEMWNSLAERFLEKDLVVVSTSLELVITLGILSKDFIRQRVIKHVIPHLNTFLQITAKNNLKNVDEANTAEYTQRFKFQSKLLEEYSKLITNLDITEQHLDNILEVLKAYLHPSQPKILQQNCKDSFYHLFSNYDSTTVIVKLSGTHLAKSSPFKEIYSRITKYNFE